MIRATRLLLGALAGACALAACGDPVHDEAVAALGDEVSSVPRGPLHRAGQPCNVCHESAGPGSPAFAVAGTIYAVRGASDPAVGAVVHVTDASGRAVDRTTNASGNFYVTSDEWSPVFPLTVVVSYGTLTATMHTRIGRDGACASCHFGKPGQGTSGPVYLATDAEDLPVSP